jgi:uncharacterized protein
VAPYFFRWINEHPTRDGYWQAISLRGRQAEVLIPVLNVAGWYDVFASAGVEAFRSLTSSPDSRLVIGPWGHNNCVSALGDLDFGEAAAWSFPRAVIGWMDRWLKGRSGSPESPVSYFSMGDLRWRSARTWPPEQARRMAFRLDSDGHANTAEGDGRLVADVVVDERSDRFVYDPDRPVPSIGGQGCCYEPQSPIGPRDQRPVERRPDVLVYTGEALERPLIVAGDVHVDLYASSTAPDTDFTAKLVDVHPDGTAVNLSEGIVRARFRQSLSEPELLVPGSIEHYRISLHPTANVFQPGHRVRLEVSSSNFPMYDRNPNTGRQFGQDADMTVAHQAIHHGSVHPSALHLWALPDPT